MKRIALFSVLLAFCSAFSHAEEWNKNFSITGTPTLKVEADDADVRIRACDCKQIGARVVWEGYTASTVKITENQNGDTVDLNVHTRSPHFNINLGERHKWIHIELTVPGQAYLDAHTGDGHIQVNGIKGQLRLHTSDGNIDIDGADGLLHAKSGDGHIRAAGRFDDLTLATGDGQIEARVLPGSTIKSSWEFHSGDGRVNVRLPEDFSANLHARTGDGGIHTDLPLTVEGELKAGREVRGKLNAGGGSLEIQTGDGSIYLERMSSLL